jgi:transcriptional regulator with XRE-family HTH domain
MSTVKNHQSELFLWGRVLSLMQRERLSAKDLAAIAGVVPSAVVKWKHGGSIGADKLQRIASHFGESVDWLLGRDDQSTLSVELRNRGVTKFGKGSGKNESPANIEDSNFVTGVLRSSEKGQTQGECRYPEGCDLAGELSSVRERLAGVEGDLAYMRTQLDTVVGLLGHALGDGIKTTRPRESARKAG